MKMKFALLRKKKGEAYIDTLVSIFIIMVFICLIIVVVPIFIKQYHLDMFADKISDFVAVRGGTAGIDIDSLAKDASIDPSTLSVSIVADPDFVSDPTKTEFPDKIQLTGKYTVTINTTIYISLGGIINSVPIPLQSVANGRSEVYWKDDSLNKMI